MEQSDEAKIREVNAILESIKPEIPGKGIILLTVHDALGNASYASNMNALSGAAVLEHMALHLRGKCADCPKR